VFFPLLKMQLSGFVWLPDAAASPIMTRTIYFAADAGSAAALTAQLIMVVMQHFSCACIGCHCTVGTFAPPA
jgi:hypothetical protein